MTEGKEQPKKLSETLKNVSGRWYMVPKPVLVLSGRRFIVEFPPSPHPEPERQRVYKIIISEFVPDNEEPSELQAREEPVPEPQSTES